MLELARGRPDAAVELAFDATERTEKAHAPVAAERSRIVAAKALSRAGYRDRAVYELNRSVGVLTDLGAYGYQAEAERELARLGRRAARRRPATGGQVLAGDQLDRLTPQERDVAALVRTGATNRQIAATLFMSEKSVERHLSRIFTKVGVRTRTALALLVAEHKGAS